MSESQKLIAATRGRVRLRGRWHMRRRQGGFSLPSAVAERLEGALAGFGNRDACAALARLLALAHRRRAGAFVVCRVALAAVAALGLSENQVRGALAVLERVGFVDRIGGGDFCRERRRRKPVLWRLGWSARKSPKEGLRPKENRFGGPGGALARLPGFIPSGGTVAAVRAAAREALDRLRGEPLPGLSKEARQGKHGGLGKSLADSPQWVVTSPAMGK